MEVATPLRARADRNVLELPPGPSSATLFLSALAGFGAWHLGRSARKFHLISHLPEWYHTGGPVQVGHATPLDLEFSLSAMPLCQFDTPIVVGVRQTAVWWLRYEPSEILHPQFILTLSDPRGPPVLS